MEQSYGDWIRSNPPMPTKNLNTKHMAQQNTKHMTALEDLINKLVKFKKSRERCHSALQAAIEFAVNRLELEKQQHGQTWDAAIKAHDERGGVHARSIVDFDEYYNETFNK
jgi:hypothetical protein